MKLVLYMKERKKIENTIILRRTCLYLQTQYLYYYMCSILKIENNILPMKIFKSINLRKYDTECVATSSLSFCFYLFIIYNAYDTKFFFLILLHHYYYCYDYHLQHLPYHYHIHHYLCYSRKHYCFSFFHHHQQYPNN